MSDEELNEEEVEVLIELNEDQAKAWKKFETAVRACRKSKIYFYQVLSSIGALNGENVQSVENVEYTKFDCGGPRDLNTVQNSFPTTEVSDAFADDTHVVIFKDDVGFRLR